MLNLRTDISCEKDSSEKPEECQDENPNSEDLHKSIEIFELKPTIQQEQIEEKMEYNDYDLNYPECSGTRVKSIEQIPSNNYNHIAEENDIFPENNAYRNLDKPKNMIFTIDKPKNMIFTIGSQAIYDKDKKDRDEILIGECDDDADDENYLMDDEIVLGDNDEELNQNYGEEEENNKEKKEYGEQSEVDYTKDEQMITEKSDPNYDPSSEESEEEDSSDPSDYPDAEKHFSKSFSAQTFNDEAGAQSSGKCRIPCDMCGKVFERVTLYRQHKIEEIETCSLKKNEAINCPYKECEYVSKVYVRDNYQAALYNMCDHLRAKHTKEAIYQCEKCPKRCFSRMSLNYHHKKHDDTSKYYCLKCDHFIQNLKFEIHEAVHNSDQFQCNVCEKIFTTYLSLYTHKALHKKPEYACTKCEKRFHQKSNLKVHMKRRHGDMYKAIHTCKICNGGFLKVIDLKAHRKREHAIGNARVKQFKCSSCLKVFGWKGNLQNHMKKCKQSKIKEKWIVLSECKITQK